MTVEVYSWNAQRLRVRRTARLAKGPLRRVLMKPVNNFGDLLAPIVVGGLLGQQVSTTGEGKNRRLFSIGSVLHIAKDGDVVWGAGRNGRFGHDRHTFSSLDVRAVRGPLTRAFLMEKGIAVPEVYGDPALLLPRFMPELRQWLRTPQHDVTVVPNLDDKQLLSRNQRVIPTGLLLNPCDPLRAVLKRIAQSRLVVGSSLHAIVVAESLGIPARAFRASIDPPFKYLDYYEGTGRKGVMIADTAAAAMVMGGAEPLNWDPEPLMTSFPADLFT